MCCTVVATRHGSSFWFLPSFYFLSLITFLHWSVSVTGVKSGESWQGGNWINQPWALWQRKGGYPLFHMVNCICHGHTPFSISVPNPHSGSSSRCDDLISDITLYKRIRIGYHTLNINSNQAREHWSDILHCYNLYYVNLNHFFKFNYLLLQ